MRRWLVRLTTSLMLALAGSYAWTHRPQVRLASSAAPAPQSDASYSEAQEAKGTVTVTGPLADYVLRQQQAGSETNVESGGGSGSLSNADSYLNSNSNSNLGPNSETSHSIARKPSASDHVGDSPVGTSAAILHRAFRVSGVVDLPFDIPAHAASPQLHGTYRSFLQQEGAASSDSSADVEFLLMSEPQYADFLANRPGDALFSADSAHNGEINFNLPPTLARAAKYYLVFRNSSPRDGKKVVQADFRVDY
jgi:hypothetical protein